MDRLSTHTFLDYFIFFFTSFSFLLLRLGRMNSLVYAKKPIITK